MEKQTNQRCDDEKEEEEEGGLPHERLPACCLLGLRAASVDVVENHSRHVDDQRR